MAQRQGNTGATFIDCYNHEFSRDIEPCADDFTDVYYYYMADYVRRYKGVTPVEPVKEIHQIAVDGKFDDWTALGTRYKDYKGDTRPRNHWGFGYKNISLTNNTGATTSAMPRSPRTASRSSSMWRPPNPSRPAPTATGCGSSSR